jgi:hypothetical protein
MLLALNDEERDAVIEQMLDKVREELQWMMTVDRAKRAAAAAPQLVAHSELPVMPTATPAPATRYCWPSGPRRAAR